MNYYALIGLFNGVVVLAVTIGVFFRKRQLVAQKSLILFSLCVGLWSVIYAIWQIQVDQQAALFWMRAAMFMVYPAPFCFFWFSIDISGYFKFKYLKLVLAVIAAFFALFSFSSLMVSDVQPRLSFHYWPVPGTLMHLYIFLFCISVFASFVVLIISWMRALGAHKWQLQWIILSMVPAWLGGMTNWLLWYGINFPPLPNFFVGVGWLLLSYAMIRTRFFDADVIADYVQEARLAAVGLLTTSIHHEIKNPVFVIRGLAENISEKIHSGNINSQQARESMEQIVQQSERITEIIRKFRDFSTRPKNKILETTQVDLNQALNGVLAIVQSQIDSHKIRINLDVPEGTSVRADLYSVEEILINLILNSCQALKNTPDPLIQVLAKQNKKRVEILIEDNGPGMSPRDVNRIFEPFYTTKEEGTGLGLYVVKELVSRNQGEVKVESKVGKGTRFVLVFILG